MSSITAAETSEIDDLGFKVMQLTVTCKSNSSLTIGAVTPDRPRKELNKVLERIARRICASHHECDMYDGYVTLHWPAFLPGAMAAYDELLKIDEERYYKTNQKD